MARGRAKLRGKSSFETVEAAEAPGKYRRPPTASPEPDRMFRFSRFQGFIPGMSGDRLSG